MLLFDLLFYLNIIACLQLQVADAGICWQTYQDFENLELQNQELQNEIQQLEESYASVKEKCMAVPHNNDEVRLERVKREIKICKNSIENCSSTSMSSYRSKRMATDLDVVKNLDIATCRQILKKSQSSRHFYNPIPEIMDYFYDDDDEEDEDEYYDEETDPVTKKKCKKCEKICKKEIKVFQDVINQCPEKSATATTTNQKSATVGSKPEQIMKWNPTSELNTEDLKLLKFLILNPHLYKIEDVSMNNFQKVRTIVDREDTIGHDILSSADFKKLKFLIKHSSKIQENRLTDLEKQEINVALENTRSAKKSHFSKNLIKKVRFILKNQGQLWVEQYSAPQQKTLKKIVKNYDDDYDYDYDYSIDLYDIFKK